MDPKLRRHGLVPHVAEEERRLVRCIRIPPLLLQERAGVRGKAAPPLGLIARHESPPDLLRVFQDTGLDLSAYGPACKAAGRHAQAGGFVFRPEQRASPVVCLNR